MSHTTSHSSEEMGLKINQTEDDKRQMVDFNSIKIVPSQKAIYKQNNNCKSSSSLFNKEEISTFMQKRP